MRKELILAIFLGGFIGIAVAFGIWRFTNTINDTAEENTPETVADNQAMENSTSEETTTSTDGLTIVRPRENAVVSNETIQLAGITKQNSHVLIIAEDDHVLKTNSGTFEQDIEVAGGINQIPVYVFTENEPILKSKVLITYSSDIENAESSQAILGAITDITETSLQIRTSDGEISQVALSGNTSYVSTVQTTRDISFEDLAIGDFVAALGQMDETDVLSAQRIIVSSPLEENTDVIAFGTVQTLTNRDFIVRNDQSGDEWSIDATDSPTVTAINDEGEIDTVRLTSEAEEGDWIIIVGEMEDDELIARRIHIL